MITIKVINYYYSFVFTWSVLCAKNGRFRSKKCHKTRQTITQILLTAATTDSTATKLICATQKIPPNSGLGWPAEFQTQRTQLEGPTSTWWPLTRISRPTCFTNLQKLAPFSNAKSICPMGQLVNFAISCRKRSSQNVLEQMLSLSASRVTDVRTFLSQLKTELVCEWVVIVRIFAAGHRRSHHRPRSMHHHHQAELGGGGGVERGG